MENINIPRMLTINEVAKETGLAKHFIRQLALSNTIQNVKAGKKILVNLEKLIEYLNGDNNQAKGKEE